MSKDQLIGALMLIGSLAILALYGYMIYDATLRIYALIIATTLAVVGVTGIVMWIGWTMATTPPPKPLETFEDIQSETANETEKKAT